MLVTAQDAEPDCASMLTSSVPGEMMARSISMGISVLCQGDKFTHVRETTFSFELVGEPGTSH